MTSSWQISFKAMHLTITALSVIYFVKVLFVELKQRVWYCLSGKFDFTHIWLTCKLGSIRHQCIGMNSELGKLRFPLSAIAKAWRRNKPEITQHWQYVFLSITNIDGLRYSISCVVWICRDRFTIMNQEIIQVHWSILQNNVTIAMGVLTLSQCPKYMVT